MAPKAKVFISSFAFGGNIPIQVATSIFAMVADLNNNGYDTSIDLRPGGPYVQKERNISVVRFLETDCTHLLFVDADLAFDPTCCRKMVEKKVDIIGGLYRYKMEKEAYPVQLLAKDSGEEKGQYVEKNGCFLAAGLPTGFMLIKREVLEKMVATFPETKYELRESDSGGLIVTVHNLFDCVLHQGKWWGEDYVFCKRALAMGYSLWAYPEFDAAHIGTFGYVGNYRAFYEANREAITLRNKQDIEEREAQDARA